MIRRMQNERAYSRLLNCQRWRKLRRWYLTEHPLCERCLELGLYTGATEVHHRQPIEDSRNPEQMAALAYNPQNLQALCRDCHAEIHTAADYHKAATVRARKDAAADEYLRSLGIE